MNAARRFGSQFGKGPAKSTQKGQGRQSNAIDVKGDLSELFVTLGVEHVTIGEPEPADVSCGQTCFVGGF
jgi:hypothetical protein